MDLLIKLTGVGLVALALVHVVFPRHFGWKKELQSVGLLTRQIFYVHTFFIALAVLLMGLLCIFQSTALQTESLGRSVAGGLAIFWGARLLIQLFGYSSELWKGRRLETCLHILFTCIWLHLTVLFGWLALGAGR